MIFYGLRIKETGEVLGFGLAANGDEYCSDVEVSLSRLSDNVWLVKNKKYAERILTEEIVWYNACYESPQNPYIGKCEVFEVEI